MVQAPDIGCLSMAPWTAHDIGLLQLFGLQLARKIKTRMIKVREANFRMMKVRATKTRGMKREWTKEKRKEQPKQGQFNCGMKKLKQDRVNKTRMMKSGATKSWKTVCIISLFQLWFKHFTLGAFPWHLEIQITLDLKHLQLFAFYLSNRILPRSYHMVLIHLFTFYCHIKCFVNISSDDLQFVIHFQYLLVNFDIFMNKMRNPNLLVIIQNLLNESVNIDTY